MAPAINEPAIATPLEPRFDAGLVADFDTVRAELADGGARVVDARPAPRFAGEAPEPRPGLRAGHMPGAFNLPFDRLLTPERRMRPAPEISRTRVTGETSRMRSQASAPDSAPNGAAAPRRRCRRSRPSEWDLRRR